MLREYILRNIDVYIDNKKCNNFVKVDEWKKLMIKLIDSDLQKILASKDDLYKSPVMQITLLTSTSNIILLIGENHIQNDGSDVFTHFNSLLVNIIEKYVQLYENTHFFIESSLVDGKKLTKKKKMTGGSNVTWVMSNMREIVNNEKIKGHVHFTDIRKHIIEGTDILFEIDTYRDNWAYIGIEIEKADYTILQKFFIIDSDKNEYIKTFYEHKLFYFHIYILINNLVLLIQYYFTCESEKQTSENIKQKLREIHSSDIEEEEMNNYYTFNTFDYKTDNDKTKSLYDIQKEVKSICTTLDNIASKISDKIITILNIVKKKNNDYFEIINKKIFERYPIPNLYKLFECSPDNIKILFKINSQFSFFDTFTLKENNFEQLNDFFLKYIYTYYSNTNTKKQFLEQKFKDTSKNDAQGINPVAVAVENKGENEEKDDSIWNKMYTSRYTNCLLLSTFRDFFNQDIWNTFILIYYALIMDIYTVNRLIKYSEETPAIYYAGNIHIKNCILLLQLYNNRFTPEPLLKHI